MTKPEKSQLIKEIEKELSIHDHCFMIKEKSAFTSDVMSNIRRLKTITYSDFSATHGEQTHTSSQPYLEEADLQIILHVLGSIEAGFVVNTVLSNDTDVAIALLYHMTSFRKKGLGQLWLRGGVGDSTIFIPIHLFFETLGEDICRVLPSIDSLTSFNITSKIGTKKSVMSCNSLKYLQTFASKDQLKNTDIQNAEQYLVYALKRDSKEFYGAPF